MKNLFRKIIIFQAILSALIGLKMIFFPYNFAPDELAKAMILFDEMQPIPDNVTFVFLILMIFVTFFSIVKLYQLKKIGRTLYLIWIVGSYILTFSSTYYVYDIVEMVLDYTITLNSGLILGLIYFSDLKKKFT
tara:strand:+ start:178 stop:579 length:402 start_codon:yes stop_codon:yes gene_type:complete